MNLDIGTVLGDYEIVGVLGAGGMGKVFKVRNTISDRAEAMKVLLPDLHGAADLADRFLREIKVQASLDHPNIAALRTAFRFENQLLMIMELVEGITLDQRLQQGPLSVDEAVSCIGQVLAALGYAHRQGVIHRDIKPANMMLTTNGVVKLLDFGIAKGGTDRKLTMTGTTMGSLYYMSPEQIRGSQTLDSRSDLYSVGVSLYELVTGKRPFDGDSQFAIMSAHLEKNPVPPIALDPRLPQALNDLILTSVQREADQRFQTAEAFGKALQSVTSRAATTMPLPVDPAPVRAAAPVVATAAPAKSSNRALWAAMGGLCAVGALVAVVQFGPWRKASAEREESPAVVSAPPAQAVPQPVQPAQPAAVPASTPAATPPEVRKQSEPVVERPRMRASVVETPQAPPASAPAAQSAPVSIPPQAILAPQQPDLAVHQSELKKVRESLVMLSARAGTVRSTLQNLQRSQSASGLGMRSDWVQAASLMDSFLQGANSALNSGDAASAKDLMEKAERQVERLEKALDR